MPEGRRGFLEERLQGDNYDKLMQLENPKLHDFVADAIELCRPESVFICTDDPADVAYIRRMAVEKAEERPLALEGHTIHYDGYHDQGRDKANTRYLEPEGFDLGTHLPSVPRRQGLAEVREFLDGAMQGREMILRVFCLGPLGSVFSLSAVQITDSFYVAHSEDLLYRSGFEQFKRIGARGDFFRVLHSCGRTENGVSVDIDRRRIYIDTEDECVYSVNTQYAGNTVGFKKLSLRLAIRKADREGWLAEHMLLMGAHGPDGRVTYFTGAFPSACGKTSTAMIPGETIIGDDLAYLRRADGHIRAANAESGIFGIIRDVKEKDDPVIWKVLTTPGERIFSNVLVADDKPYWLGDGRETPESGLNFSGEWRSGKKDTEGREIPKAHPNARYTIRLTELDNLDPEAENPEGVPLGGIIYGGRDSDTCVPVQQAFDWAHGVVTMGASIESETTSATLGKTGVRAFQPMSIQDFLSITLGRYIQNYFEFGAGLEECPRVFAVNYFQKKADGSYLTGMKDKYVWLKWMERRVHGELGTIKSPTGYLPLYEDLAALFTSVLGSDYSKDEYAEQFTIRTPENLAKIERILGRYRKLDDMPRIFFTIIDEQRARLEALMAAKGEYVSPFDL